MAGLLNLEGGEISITVSSPFSDNPVLHAHHLSDYVSPRSLSRGSSRRVQTPISTQAEHQRSRRTLRAEQVEGSSQAKLAFNQPNESIRLANSSGHRSFSEQVGESFASPLGSYRDGVNQDLSRVDRTPLAREVPPLESPFPSHKAQINSERLSALERSMNLLLERSERDEREREERREHSGSTSFRSPQDRRYRERTYYSNHHELSNSREKRFTPQRAPQEERFCLSDRKI